jgi:multidrug efflux pump subunit AcrA (membrane-fusion protein)
MFASIKIGSAATQSAVMIPNSAVVVDGSDSLAFVQQSPGRFRRQKVELGEQVGDDVIVKSGLNPGEVVASRGALLLNEIGKAK